MEIYNHRRNENRNTSLNIVFVKWSYLVIFTNYWLISRMLPTLIWCLKRIHSLLNWCDTGMKDSLCLVSVSRVFSFEVVYPWIHFWACPLARRPLSLVVTESQRTLWLSATTFSRSILEVAVEGRGTFNWFKWLWESGPLDQFLAGNEIHIW